MTAPTSWGFVTEMRKEGSLQQLSRVIRDAAVLRFRDLIEQPPLIGDGILTGQWEVT